MQIPTTIFTGFLGSGKTTIISHLIDELQAGGQQVVYIKNEIGETDIDSQMMQGKGIKTEELLNGCICCTLVGPFLNSIDDLIKKFKPDRIIIEASGAADPVALALMVSSHPRLLRDGVISIIDVVNFEGFQDLTITAKDQTKFTDLLGFNKVELVDLEHKKKIVGYIRELNSHSPIVEAPLGKLDPQLVFGLNSTNLDELLVDHQEEAHSHLKADGFETVTIKLNKIYNATELQVLLATLPKNLIRVKGIVQTNEGWKLLNMVGNRITLIELENPGNNQSILVFIGRYINQQESELLSIFTT